MGSMARLCPWAYSGFIDDEDPENCRIEPSFNQIVEQGLHRSRVLGGSFNRRSFIRTGQTG